MQKRSGSVLAKYLLLQVPGWVLAALALALLWWWVAIPLWAATGFFLLWVIKDFALFPVLRAAYESDSRNAAERLIGERAVAVERLDPAGYVRVHGELWRAEVQSGDAPVLGGHAVTVAGVRGFTLLVQNDRPESRTHARVPP